MLSPDCQESNSRPRNIIHLKQRKFPIERSQFIKPILFSGNIFICRSCLLKCLILFKKKYYLKARVYRLSQRLIPMMIAK